MIALAVLMVLTYLAFVFFAENFNPFVKPKLHMHRVQWRYGRRMALAVLIGGFSVIYLLSQTETALHSAVATGIGIAAVLGLCFSIGKIRQVIQGGE